MSHLFAVNKNNYSCALHSFTLWMMPLQLVESEMMMKRCVRGGRKKTPINRRRGLLQGHHEYEHWLHHAIITKLLAVPRRMRGLDRADTTHLNHWPLPPAVLRLSTYEGCAAKDHLTITPVSMTQDQGGCREKERREGGKVSGILPAKWFEVMFDNELWICEMCHGYICIYCFNYIWIFWFVRTSWCRAVS